MMRNEGKSIMDSLAMSENDVIVLMDVDSIIQKPIVGHQMVVVEIPDMMAVETRFITKHMASQNEIMLSNVLLLSQLTADEEADTQAYSKNILETKDVGVTIEPDISHAFIQTDSPNPLRERGVQVTKVVNQVDVGIQCDRESNRNIEELQPDVNPLEDCNEDYQIFLEFVQKHTVSHNNSKKECLVCGEICSDSAQTLSHMTIHWGPPALCEFCGRQVKHANLLLLHKCCIKLKHKHRKRIQHQQCPLYSCGLMTKSKLRLYDHINEHLGLASFRCLSCKRSFRTTDEMRRHFEDQSVCLPKFARLYLHYKSSHRKKNGIHSHRVLLTQKHAAFKIPLRSYFRDALRCQICLVKCLSPSLFAIHRKKCIKSFMNTLKETRSKEL